MTDTHTGWQTPADLAAELGCSRGWIVEQFRSGRIPAIRVGRSWRFGPEHRAAWIAASLAGTTEPSPAAVEPVGPVVDQWERVVGRRRRSA